MLKSSPLLALIIAIAVSLAADLAAVADEWPQWRGPQRDGVWRETGVLEKFAGPKIDVAWRAKIGAGYCGPTVADGRVVVMDRVAQPKQIERIHAFDAKSGETLWTVAYDCPYVNVSYTAGPRASVALDSGRAYALGTMGDLHAIDAKSGEIVWRRDLNRDYAIRMPIWGIAASPLIDGDRLILQIGGADGACLIALDKNTGKEIWRALDDPASYSAPILLQQAGRDVLVAWTGASVAGLDPASGKLLWRHPFKPAKMVINIATPVLDGDRLFLTSFYDGAMMLELDPQKLQVEELWSKRGPSERDTDALHSIIATPYLKNDHIYGFDSYGEFRCLKQQTGERVWEDLSLVPKIRWGTAHMVENGDRVWMFTERGELIITRLAPAGVEEISRAKLISPTTVQLSRRDGVCWAHPAYAYKRIFVRNDEEIVCADLSAAE